MPRTKKKVSKKVIKDTDELLRIELIKLINNDLFSGDIERIFLSDNKVKSMEELAVSIVKKSSGKDLINFLIESLKS